MTVRLTLSLPATDETDEGLRLLLVALAGTFLFHGGLLPFTHANTYDAFIHMFFGDHYNRSWFDPWEPRWYTGFSTTSYPPGAHMAVGALQFLVPLRVAYVVVQISALLLLAIGVFRFALLWVPSRAAGYAAVALLLSSSLAETVHLFGQLPTTLSLGIFLNGLPYVHRWIVTGGWRSLGAAIAFSAATTASHHVTTIFGGLLFIAPLGMEALREVHTRGRDGPRGLRAVARSLAPPLLRSGVLAGLMLGSVILTVFPYWYWSVSDPITQVPIPHGSRESFLARPDLGFIFFILPWGTGLFVLPYVFWKSVTTRLWPLGLSVVVCFVLGTGGTTPIPRIILRGAFDILTLDRFTFWATILVLPFAGLLTESLLHGSLREAIHTALGRAAHRALVAGAFIAMTVIVVFAAILPTIRPTQPGFIDPAPIVQFLAQDEHDRWRYLTLGFGDQFAYLSAQTTAQSVDGNYHSARRLPDLTRFSVERLENAKYLGVPGLGSLRQFLVNAERYHLKYVFSNDAFYDPLLHFTGWTRLTRLANAVTVWEKPDISPLPRLQPRRTIPEAHVLMWSVLPPAALLLATPILAADIFRNGLGRGLPGPDSPPIRPGRPPARRTVQRIAAGLAISVVVVLAAGGWQGWKRIAARNSPERVIEAYFDHLDARRFDLAYTLLDPVTRGAEEEILLAWRWRGGLLASYGKLQSVALREVGKGSAIRDWIVEISWLTALVPVAETLRVRSVLRDGKWYVAPIRLRPSQTPVRLQRQEDVAWNVVGRRQPRAETDLHRDRLDRPRVAVYGARIVRRAGRYHAIGQVTNADVDPAAVSLFAELVHGDEMLAWQTAGHVGGERLLPAESAGFRVDFEGVLSIGDGSKLQGFDPSLWIPPELAAIPNAGRIEARALVRSHDLYRGVALNALRSKMTPEGLVLTGLAVNVGTKTSTITRISALLFGPDGLPLWAEAGFIEANIYPGQSAPFHMVLPQANEIEIVAGIHPDAILSNGAEQEADLPMPSAVDGTIPLPPESGYAALRLYITSMTYDPLF